MVKERIYHGKPNNTLYVDSRESRKTKEEFIKLGETEKNLVVFIVAMTTGDFRNKYAIMEAKSIDDLISSITQKIPRKNGTIYERLDEQVARLISDPAMYKYLLVHGNLDECYSKIHPNAVRGQLASISAQGINLVWQPANFDFNDMVLRIHYKTMKYGEQRVLNGEFQ